MAPTDTIALPTAADVDRGRAKARGRRDPHAADQFAGARRAARRAGVPQGRDAAAHRLVQVPRRLQQDFLDPAGQARRRRRGLFVRQSRAGRGARGAALQHAGGDRDAVGRAEGQARAHRGARRRGRAVRPRHARTARRSRATSRRSAARCWCRRSTIRWSSPGRAPPAARSSRTWTTLGLKPDVVVVGASGGGLIAGIALAMKARVPGAKFYSAEPEGFDDTAALVQERPARDAIRA